MIHISHASTLDGSPIHHTEEVQRGKAGRSLSEQVQSRIDSRVSKQRDKGYVDDIDEAAKGNFNQLGFESPMLAQSYKNQTIRSGYVQPKLNGLRCLITKQDGNVVAYTRRGKELPHIHEILAEIEPMLEEGQTFDGELYMHGASLQTIQSMVKRRQKTTADIMYVIYDTIENESFEDRFDTLLKVFANRTDGIRVGLCPTYEILPGDFIKSMFRKFLDDGYEGLMIRHSNDHYAVGRRSSALLKYKPVYDTEVIVKDIILSEKGNPVCIAVYNGIEFKVSPPGSHADRENAYLDKHKYIGTRLTIEYREITDDGKPFHAVGVNWRKD